MGFEDLASDLQQLADPRVPEPIVDQVAGLAGVDQVLHPQDGQLLGGTGALGSQFHLELADALLPGLEQLQDPDASRVRQGLKELRLEVLE